ncbi:hypothetical protein EDD11_002597 [Mortierella claussenii]|nr:hypothetical protein EDD11_002597 [Mortierella claussenii]
MASNTMNFGPEWMRRFPAKSSQSSNDQHARAPSPPPAAPPLQDWAQPTPAATTASALPAFSYSSIAASNVRSQNGAAGQTMGFEASSTDGSTSGNNGVSSSGFAPDSLNPFKYSKELMLSLYRPTGLPIEFERHEYMTSEESLQPMSSLPFSEQEIKLLAGSVNSEVARRTTQPGEGTQERIQGQRRESFSNTGEHSAGRYDRSEKGASHSRTYEPRNHGVGARPRNLNSESRGHSFRRTEQIGREREREREREPEDDGLWNSPVGNTVGSFDANGVFRILGDGEDLQSLGDLQETAPKRSSDDAKAAGSRTADDLKLTGSTSRLQEPLSVEQASSKADQPSPTQHQQKLQDKVGDSFLFSSSLLSGKGLGSGPVREDAEFASFGGNQSSPLSSAAVLEPSFEPLPVDLSKWLYRDPSGSIQGPFSSQEMHEWYKGGFFSPELLVKREQDPTFEPLGSLIRRIGSEDKPFLLAGIIRSEQSAQSSTPLRPTIPSLAQNRQQGSQMNLSPGWAVGMSAPSTPSTPSFGVDRLLLQQQQLQQQQQQHSSGDLFSSTNNLGQQRAGFGAVQETSAAMPGLESRWNSNVFTGRGQNVESSGGWGNDAFSRSSVGSMSAAHTPLGGPHYMDQQQRLHSQEIERQQYMQLLQRQAQMQAILHQQQFMAAQQQFGNDPHALAALLAQQQGQQRQLQMRYQQLQFAGLHAQAPSTPGGTAVPWGGMNMGIGQPSSPWTTSIIPSSSDNYFDYNKADGSQIPHSVQQQRQQQSQMQHQPFQPFQQDQSQQHQEDAPLAKDQAVSQDALPSQHDSVAAHSLSERLESLELRDDVDKEQIQPAAIFEKEEEEEEEEAVTEQTSGMMEDIPAKQEREEPVQQPVYEDAPAEPEHQQKQEEEKEQQPERQQEEEDQQDQESVEENLWETASSGAAESTHRTIKASPAPWAKPVNADEDVSERRGPTLREIQEMEAKKAEEARVERQVQLAAAAAAAGTSVLDFTKGMSGAPAWSNATSTTPKKKTLKEIQQEEEAAMKRARASAQQVNPSAPPQASQSTGLATIVASSNGSAGRRYADTVGPKPATVAANSGPWGSATSGVAARPSLVTRSSSMFASNPSLNSPTNVASRNNDNSWIEVGPKHSTSASSSPAVSRSSAIVVAPVSSKVPSNSNEPRPASEEFLRWCRQALKDLQNVVLEDFIQMLLTFPLNPDPMTVEIISESIYANSKSLNGRQFADEFIKRRKADAYPHGAPASMNASGSGAVSGSGAGVSDTSFKVVSKKGKKKGTA